MRKQVTPLAQKMIDAKGLAEVLSKVLGAIQTLDLPGPQTQNVDIEWERDPEVEGWEMLSITLWCPGSADRARTVGGELGRAMDRLRQKLPRADLEKLDRFVSVGVDIQ